MKNDIQNNNNKKCNLQRRFTKVRVNENLKVENFYNRSFEMNDLEIQNVT